MDKNSDKLLEKFISGKRLTEEEFILLDKLLNDLNYRKEISLWLEQNWQQSQTELVSLRFEQIREKIITSSSKVWMNRLIIGLSKAAAVLFIPLLAAFLYFSSDQKISTEYLTLSTQKGEQTSVILPDGTKVWLNVDTKLSYQLNYGVNSRNLELEGEAYFEVEKNKDLPFMVTSGDITTTALGTRFIISAYPEFAEIKSSLVNGSVQVQYGKVQDVLKPGQQLVYNKIKHGIQIKPFDENDALAWKDNQLFFRLMPFGNVITELEKWYNINIDYNPALFKSETLTVRFEKYETLEQVLQVISKANGFNYTIEGKNVKITK